MQSCNPAEQPLPSQIQQELTEKLNFEDMWNMCAYDVLAIEFARRQREQKQQE